MDRQRILVTVKTYPTLSTKYGETVCTAAVKEDGTWVRLYPVPFRRLEEEEQYRKYDWIECQLARNTRDPRPESFRPVDQRELRPVGHVGTSDRWRDRRRILLERTDVYHRLDELIEKAKENSLSLAVFKPTAIDDFICEDDDRNWNADKLNKLRERYSQLDLFSDNWDTPFRIIPKLPYSFSYRFRDAAGRRSTLQVLDWETGALYWNCLQSTENDEVKAIQKVRQKYLNMSVSTDLHFFLGTTQQWHRVAPNPWVIVGVFPIPYETQLSLLR